MGSSKRRAITDAVELAREVGARLASTAAFKVELLEGERATPELVAEAEERIGCTLPEGLRRLYREGLAIYWTVVDGEALGYEQGCEPTGGQLELVRLTDLGVRERGLVRFTNDGNGNGFCLDPQRARRGLIPIVFWDHDDEEAMPTAPSFDAFFAKWAALGFAANPIADGDLEQIKRFLKTGKLPERRAAKPQIVTGRASPLPRELRPLPADLQVYGAVLVGDDRVLVAGCSPVVRLVDLSKPRVVREIASASYVYGLAVSSDGRRMVCAGESGAQIVHLEGEAAAEPLIANAQWVAAFAEDEASVILGGKDGAISAYDSDTKKLKWRAAAHDAAPVSLAVAAGGWIVSHSFDPKSARVCVHDPRDGREVGRLEGPFLRPGSGVALSVDRSELFAPLGGGAVARVSLADLTPPRDTASSEGPAWYRVAALDAKRVIAGRDGVFEVWDLATGRVERTLEVENGGLPSAIVVRGDRQRVLLASYTGWLAEWRVAPDL